MHEDIIERVIAIAEDAGKILLKHYKGKLTISYKTNKFDPVTEADLEADKFIRKRLAEEFPGEQVMTEEQEVRHPLDYTRCVWVVDPLDGTKYFVRELDLFSVSIGLLEQGAPTLGVVHIPTAQKTYYAVGGCAYLRNASGTKPIMVTKTKRLAHATDIIRMPLGETKPYDALVARVLKRTRARTIIGTGAAIKICMVAEGKADVLVNPSTDTKKWDTCAAQCILEAAGGRLTRFDGSPLDYTQKSPVWADSYVASNGTLHDELIAELQRELEELDGTH